MERFIRGRMKKANPPPHPKLPLALVAAGRKGLRLAAVNATARSFGLAPGQRLADARTVLPELLTEPHEPEQDMASLLGLCRWLERYSPQVASDAPDGALLDATGVPHLFGGETAMLAEIKARLTAYGYGARIAMAQTIGAAWGMARHGNPDKKADKDKIEALPVEALRITGEAALLLRRLGLKTVGALLTIPRASLARRFRGETIPENVLLRLDEMMGFRDEPLNPLNPPPAFIAHRALMEPLISAEGLESLLTGLCTLLTRDLETAGQGALRLVLKLYRSDGLRIALPAGLSAPSNDPAHLFRLIRPKLETVDAGFGIDAMTLEARETGVMTARQYGFMEDTGEAAFERLNDRVMNRQETMIASLAALESHIPERAETKVPAGRSGLKRGPGRLRPLLVFERAEQTSVIASVPDGPPMRFTWRRVTRRVVKSEGPERVAPEWWKLEAGERPRDYYMIEDERGRRYWLYREGLYGEPGEMQPKWFVHGLSA
jgi:protein ImuB